MSFTPVTHSLRKFFSENVFGNKIHINHVLTVYVFLFNIIRIRHSFTVNDFKTCNISFTSVMHSLRPSDFDLNCKRGPLDLN